MDASIVYPAFGTPTVGSGKGSECAFCTIFVGLLEQEMQIKNHTAQYALYDFCHVLPDFLSLICFQGSDKMGIMKNILALMQKGESADTVCHATGACTPEQQQCRLFPAKSPISDEEHIQHVRLVVEQEREHRRKLGLEAKFNICQYLPGLCRFEKNLPAVDNDGDFFSTSPTFRGTYFRGKDCNDNNSAIFPGRNTLDTVQDENCNGIYGVDRRTGRSYEDLWCEGTGAMGVAVLGDSATAHFRLPPAYFTAKRWSRDVFSHLYRLIEDTADWPMLSWGTGFLNTSDFYPDVTGNMTSLYSKMVEHNRCNHRDYQNIGVNGAKSTDLSDFVSMLNRNASKGVKPLLIIMSMIGNDVCGRSLDFTPPDTYRQAIIDAIKKVDAVLPSGSHIVLFPLADGRILYDTLHNRIHPIGMTNNDVTYAHLYDYLNCLDISPCRGWMNSNATIRNQTYAHAQSLNDQIPIIVKLMNGTLRHTQVHYFGDVIGDCFQDVPKDERWKLIEPTDGFHPSQMWNSLAGQYLFETIAKSGILKGPNPYNMLIKRKFGDQGGY